MAAALTDHVLLCGLGELGVHTLERLLAFGERVVVVDPDPPPVFLARCEALGVPVVVGSGRDPRVLHQAGVSSARAVIAVASDDMVNLGIALAANDENPELRIVVRLFNERLVHKLERELPQCRVLDVSAIAAPIFAYAGLHADIHHCVDVPGGRYLLRRWRGDRLPPALPVLTVRRAARLPAAATPARLAHTIAAGPIWDHLPLDAPPGPEDQAYGFAHVADADAPDVAGALGREAERRRMKRRVEQLARRALRTASQDAMVLVFAFMALMVLVGIVVFRDGMGLSWHHSAYFVVTTMTTTGYGDISAKDAPYGVMAFVILLMLFGSIFMAVLSAYFTEKLLALRMGALFGRKPVPTSGHFIIVGLGTVGYRIAEELLSAGHACVALEREAESRLVERARRAGVPVVVSADVFTALADVNLEDARGVIAVTNDDAANLEIALMAQEAAPGATVVARIFDPSLAAHLQRAFGIHLSRSPSAIAAPAFAVAAASGQLLDAFDLGDTLFCVGQLPLPAGHPFIGRDAADLARGETLVLTCRRAGGSWRPAAGDGAPFAAGDELVIVAPRPVWLAMGAEAVSRTG